jgi:transcriptional regulator with XRE-family HTH domain
MPVDAKELERVRAEIQRLLGVVLAADGITQEQLAAHLGITQGYLSKLKKAKFQRVTEHIRRLLEYSKKSSAWRVEKVRGTSTGGEDLAEKLQRITSADPTVGRALEQIVDRLAKRSTGR